MEHEPWANNGDERGDWGYVQVSIESCMQACMFGKSRMGRQAVRLTPDDTHNSSTHPSILLTVAVEPLHGDNLFVTGAFISSKAYALAGLTGTAADPIPSLLKVGEGKRMDATPVCLSFPHPADPRNSLPPAPFRMCNSTQDTLHDTTRPTQVDATTATMLWAKALPVRAAHVALDNFGGIFLGGSYSQVRTLCG